MIEEIRKKNEKYDIQPVENESFSKYGRVIEEVSLPEMEKFVRSTDMPETEFYDPCTEALMSMGKETDLIQNHIYGQIPCQIGYYNGRCDRLNAVEYHKCSEVLVLLEDAVLIVATITDIKDEMLDTAKMKYFYVQKGTCVELYATTLHWAPCAVGAEGVRQIVIQAKGTNTPLLHPVEFQIEEDKYLLERNKWVFIHEEAKEVMSEKAYVGLLGENPVIRY